MNKKISNFTIDFLIADAKVRLAFERSRNKQNMPPIADNIITFLPLAAAGRTIEKKMSYFSQDHNFLVSFQQQVNHCVFELQAQGFSGIQLVQSRSAQVCFEKQFYYLAQFDHKGLAKLLLPLQSPNNQSWQVLGFTLKI